MHPLYTLSCALFLAAACTEYDVTAKTDDAAGAADAAVDTAEPVEPSEPPAEEPDEPCTEVVTAFDIEELSVLQDAASPYLVATQSPLHTTSGPWYRDALVLTYLPPDDGFDSTWRVAAVEVLVMVPTARMGTLPDGERLTIEVFDGANPRMAPSWTETQPIVYGDLSWSDYVLPFDAAISGISGDFNQRGAWARFDFRSTISESGMVSPEFVVGVKWESMSQVAVGYSNFNRACNRNWTEWAPGSGWNMNGDSSTGDVCSWPMLRVEIERTFTDECE
tara:strand:- start:230 stop:1063 length:834 start_codon:yes stop_codon:yes gene_type:complete